MPDYRNPALPVEERVENLLEQMTLEEMIFQTDQYSSSEFMSPDPDKGEKALSADPARLDKALRGNSAGSVQIHGLTPAQVNALQKYAVEHTRLGIPFLFSEEALHGVSHPDATSFPQQIGLAATFRPELGRKMGRAIGTEARALGIAETFSPVMDLIRDPRYGRTEESYGEDTFLCSAFAGETVAGLQGESLSDPDAVAAEPKHYVGYGAPVGGLNCAPCALGRREVYTDALPVFEEAVAGAGAVNVMCSYNAIDGLPVSSDKELLTEILRDRWGMRGFVRSDMTAVERLYDNHYTAPTRKEAIAMGLEAGVDLQLFDFPHDEWQGGIREQVLSGRLDRSVVRQACARVLRVKFLLGLFENPYVDESRKEKFVHSDAHVALALDIARESVVLLKNQNNVLPLKKDLGTVAVLGPCADRAVLGDYTPGGKDRDGTAVTVLDGVRRIAGQGTRVLFDEGCKILGDMARPFPHGVLTDEEGDPGLTGRYYRGSEPGQGEPVSTVTDRSVDFNWLMNGSPIREETYSVTWTGFLTPRETFDGLIGFRTEDSMRLYIDGQLILDGWGEYRSANRTVPFRYEKDRRYAVRIDYTNDRGGARVLFGWDTVAEDFSRAAELARQADAVILCVGDSTDTCGENLDRITLDLPGNQPAFVTAVTEAAAEKGVPVILVSMTGRPTTFPKAAEKIPAILEAWFPGEQGGAAVAETLFGDSNPSGRLPISFPRTVGQIPCHYSRRPGGGKRYVETDWLPLYPFGYGLSYTEFRYDGLTLSADEIEAGEPIEASFTVTNTGSRPGDAVPQLYLRDMVSSTVKPQLTLAAFDKIRLEPGESKRVTLTIRPREMRTLGPDWIWRVEKGDFRVSLAKDALHMVETKGFRVK
ncbi:MAG: beta-glucosidase [Ruminococcaceae bacterium]|nr:beta-glucosidase [Oscillospiraceae bacterium]